MHQRPGQRPQPSIDQLLANAAATVSGLLRQVGARATGAAVLLVGAVVSVVWLVSGVYSVEPSEQAVLRMFGKYDTTVESGLHWYWPWPVGKRVKYPVLETRRMDCLLYTSPSPRDRGCSRMPSSA